MVLLPFVDRFGFDVLTDDTKRINKIRENIGLDVIPRHLKLLEAMMAKSTTGWIANTENPTIADFAVVPRLNEIRDFIKDELMFDVLYAFPLLRDMSDRLMNLPPIKCHTENNNCEPKGEL